MTGEGCKCTLELGLTAAVGACNHLGRRVPADQQMPDPRVSPCPKLSCQSIDHAGEEAHRRLHPVPGQLQALHRT